MSASETQRMMKVQEGPVVSITIMWNLIVIESSCTYFPHVCIFLCLQRGAQILLTDQTGQGAIHWTGVRDSVGAAEVILRANNRALTAVDNRSVKH